MSKNFRSLGVWQKAHCLTLSVYHATKKFPTDERYGITSQLRRSSASIPANIAEGCGRKGDAEFARFLNIAMGSASETEYYLLLSRDLKILDGIAYSQLAISTEEVKRMLASLVRTVISSR